jgi:hypothetical protein
MTSLRFTLQKCKSVLMDRSKRALSRTLVLTTALGLALASTAIPTLAKTERIHLAGTEQNFFSGPPAQQWTSGRWTQLRGVPLTGSFTFRGAGITLAGSETQVTNAKLDFATGEGNVWGVVTYTDTATGLTCTGQRIGKLTHFLMTGTVDTRCSNSAHLRGSLHDTFAIPGDHVNSNFLGELLSPGEN